MAAKTSDTATSPLPRPTRIAPAETPKAALASPVLVAAVLVAGLYVGREILIPIAIAVLLSFVLGPMVNLLRRLHLPRLPAVVLTVLTTLGLVVAIGTLIGVQVADLAGDVPRYRDTIERKIEGLRESPAGRLTDYVANIGRAFHNAGHENAPDKDAAAKEAGKPPAGPAPKPEEKPVLVEVKDRQPGAVEMAGTLLSPTLQPLATAGIVFIVLLFILMQREDLRDRMIRLAGSSDLHRTTVAMDDAARRLSRFFVVQLALNAGFGLVVGIGLYFIGVPNPVLWGIFSGLMRFVPYIGAFLSALFPLALAAAVDPGWNMLISTAILFLVIEPITGHVIEPMLYGHSTGLSPFSVLVSALFWTWLWGPVGLLLSTPLTVVLVVLGRHVEKLEFLDVMLGDRQALTPVENFYQRILADDPREVQEHADLILKTCSLPAYYDDIVVKGLELAARDAARGVLSAEQKGAIRESLGELIEEMDGHEESEAEEADRATIPAAWTQEGAVLCVSGRGFADVPVAAILAQLLRNQGIGARTVAFGEVARSNIGTFEPGAARMICVVSLAISGEPAHLRRLVRRLSERMPGLPIAVGLWRADEPGSAADALGVSVGADAHLGSLREALDTVLATAQGTVRTEEPSPSAPPERPVALAGA